MLLTGSHGAGVHMPAICDWVTSMSVVGADARIVTIDASNPEMGGYRTSLGMLGLVDTFTIKCQPLSFSIEDDITLPFDCRESGAVKELFCG